VALVAEPTGAVAPIVPVMAPLGTVSTSCVGLALETVEFVPLKDTMFWLGVAENPVPEIVTVLSIEVGENAIIETCDHARRSVDVMLPTAS